jgi:hypothetical protein
LLSARLVGDVNRSAEGTLAGPWLGAQYGIAVVSLAHPEGTRLPALERNILKFRAFEMVLMLFHVEDLKGMMIGAVSATHRIRDKKPRKWRPKLREALRILVGDGMVRAMEEDRIVELVDIRNLIAHEMHQMTYDVNRDRFARSVLRFEKVRYRYRAWKEVKDLHRTVVGRMRSKYVFEASMDSLLFRAAEKAYEGELKRLEKKIDAQLAARKGKIDALRSELSLEGTEFDGDNFPSHPANTTRSGNLTKRGVEVCFGLFDLGKSPLAVANLMDISLKAIKERHRQWVKAGGKDRRRSDKTAANHSPSQR